MTDNETYRGPEYPSYTGFHAAPPPPPPEQPLAAPHRRARTPIALLAAVALAAAALGGGAAAAVGELTADSPTTSGTGSANGTTVSDSGSKTGTVAGVAQALSPSVVEIKARGTAGEATGSGVIITEDGEILTNNHVVSGAQEVTVTFADGSTATAEVVGTDPDLDMALIKVSGKSGLKAAPLGDSSKVKVGDEVVAFGSPEGLTGTVTSGIVSALNREVTVQKEQEQTPQGGEWPFGYGGEEYNGKLGGETTSYKAFQTDASINPGNSGGPMVNLQGEVIGINAAMYSTTSGSIGLGFAIPINDVKQILDDLRKN